MSVIFKMIQSLLFLQYNQFYLLRFLSLFVFVFVITVPVTAQIITDSISVPFIDSLPAPAKDSLVYKQDTIAVVQTADSVSKRPLQQYATWEINPAIPFSKQILKHHPYFNFDTKPLPIHSDLKKFDGKEILFYALAGLLLIFSLLKLAFAKYFNDLFRVFFRTTLKQRQIREQLMQSPLPSMAFNAFFVASTGLYIDLLLQHFKQTPVENFWLLYLYCCMGISVIYFVKFAGITICGWLFNLKRAADSYIFIVFIINKVIGIFLLPVTILLGIIEGRAYSAILVLSWCGIGGLLLYRFILSYAAIRNEVRFNLFHFFLYLFSFELAPLLLIYKLLLLVF